MQAPNTFKMHPRNIHNQPSDFEEMAAKDERFRQLYDPTMEIPNFVSVLINFSSSV